MVSMRFHGDECKKGSEVLICVSEFTLLRLVVAKFSKQREKYLINQLYSGLLVME